MNVLQFYAQLFSFLGTLVGFIYGIGKIWLQKKPMYMKLVVMAVACAMLARLFNISILITEEEARTTFTIANICAFGTFFGFLSANAGQIDGLVDDKTNKSSQMILYRLIPAVGSVIIALSLIPLFQSSLDIFSKIGFTLVIVTAGAAIYYQIKHIIIPDVENGITKSIKAYNIFASSYALLSVVEILAFAYKNNVVYTISTILLGILITLTVIALDKGIRKWRV